MRQYNTFTNDDKLSYIRGFIGECKKLFKKVNTEEKTTIKADSHLLNQLLKKVESN